MEELDRAMLSEDGLARGAYSPYPTPPTLSAHSNSTTCAQHTSDGNDQHSSCDVHGDCAVGRGPAAVASADLPLVKMTHRPCMHLHAWHVRAR